MAIPCLNTDIVLIGILMRGSFSAIQINLLWGTLADLRATDHL